MFILTKCSVSKKQQVAGKTCGGTQSLEDAQAQGKLRNSGTRQRGTKNWKGTQGRNNSALAGKTSKNSLEEHGQLYRQDRIIWQGRRAKTRCIYRGGTDGMACRCASSAPSAKPCRGGRTKRQGKTGRAKTPKHRTLTVTLSDQSS